MQYNVLIKVSDYWKWVPALGFRDTYKSPWRCMDRSQNTWQQLNLIQSLRYCKDQTWWSRQCVASRMAHLQYLLVFPCRLDSSVRTRWYRHSPLCSPACLLRTWAFMLCAAENVPPQRKMPQWCSKTLIPLNIARHSTGHTPQLQGPSPRMLNYIFKFQIRCCRASDPSLLAQPPPT